MDSLNRPPAGRLIVTVTLLCLYASLAPPALAEEGDSPLEAVFLPRNTELTGEIRSEYAANYYKVVMPATGRLVIRLFDIVLQDTRDELHLTLLQTSQNSVGTDYTTYQYTVAESKNDSQTPDIIDIPDLCRGIYFVKVTPHEYLGWNGATYKIKAEITVFPPVVSDDVGDRKQYALPIVNRLATNCTLSGDNDVDYFECHLPYNMNLTLSVTNIESGGNVDIEVFTALDVLVGSATQAGNADELLHLPDLVPGQYFIKLSGQGTPQYTFTASQEFTLASDILDDVGNDLAHAMPLLPGNPSVFYLQPYNIDNDVFSIYQPEDGPLTVDVYNIHQFDGRDDLYVTVFNEYGHAIAQSDNASRVPEHIEVHLPRGQYFIDVHGQEYLGFNGAMYTINVETAGSDVGDAFNRAMQIHAIPYGSQTYGYPYIGMIDDPKDADFFQVVLKDNGFIYLEVDRMLYANVDVQLFDAHHMLLQTSANPSQQPEMIYVDGLEAGLYFIKVYSLDDVGQYRLTPTIGTPTSPIGDDLGDGIDRAFPLIPYRRVSGYVWSDYTSDYFSFVLDEPASWVRIRVFDQKVWDTRDDIKLHVYNAAQDQIGYSDNDVLEDEYVELIDLEPGVYYIRIAPQEYLGMNPVQYGIVLETETAPLPTGQLYLADSVQGVPGGVVYVPVMLDNTEPDDITSMTLGVQFDPDILQAIGVANAGLTLEQPEAHVRYARSPNTLSVSMDNFATTQSGPLLNLIFQVQPDASPGSMSPLSVLTAGLNGATVPGGDGSVTVVEVQ